MNISCDIIKDLLPLYCDGVCSQESKVMLEEHLMDCTQCKDYYNRIKNEVFQKSFTTNIEQAKVTSLISLKRKLFKKNVIVSVVSIICVFIILLGCFSFISLFEIPIEYRKGLVDVKLAYDEVIDVYFNGDNYNSLHAFYRKINKDGIEQDVAFIHYTDTILTKYLPVLFKSQRNHFSIGKSIMIDYGKNGEPIESSEEINAVYYLIGDYTDIVAMPNDEFENVMKKAILIWEK